MRKYAKVFILACVFLGVITSSARADWEGNLAWCARDSGPPDCPEQYLALQLQRCLGPGGNRSCLIHEARQAAKNDCSRAFR
jgi:hypothetical protein